MYPPLQKLEDINAKSRIQITKVLSLKHNVRMAAGRGEATENSCRGIAFFSAFDPWQTCWRLPPGSVRYFDAAEKQNLLTREEAELISHTLVRFGSEIAASYKGYFQSYFQEPRVRNILNHVNDLDHLSESGLAIADSWVDRLLDACPGPFLPDRHLEVNSFRQINISEEIEFFSELPWLSWNEALDVANLGLWAGISASEIIQIIHNLWQNDHKNIPRDSVFSENIFGNKVTIPVLSRGVQGVVFGIFYDVPKINREPIFTSLMQFGETLGDVYADFRIQHFCERLADDLDDAMLAQELINLISPIGKLIVERSSQKVGYKLAYEEKYLAGYRPLTNVDLEADMSEHAFSVDGPFGTLIHVEPLVDIPNFNPEFARMRLESCLKHTLGSIDTSTNGPSLPFSEARQLRVEFEAHQADPKASLAKLRQYYVIQKIEKFWHKGRVTITNSELKTFLEDQGRSVKTGYQVTSFAGDFEKIFSEKVVAVKNRNALSFSWNKGASRKTKSRNT